MNGSSVNDVPGRNLPQQDPGELENRMSLDPSNPDWKDLVGNWEDGVEYTMQVRVRQVSPGEFEVIKVLGGDAATESDSAETAETPDEETADGAAPEGVAPGVAKMMARQKY